MRTIDTLIIGGGQAGLAMSRSLGARGVEHVVLERGRVGQRWRTERWESLRLLTPRWLSRLSGWGDDGGDPHGFMTRVEVIDYLERFARASEAPVESGVTVVAVERRGAGYHVATTAGDWSAARVVIATGQSQDAFVPTMARDLSGGVLQVVPTEYWNPDQLPAAGVLVVGASSTGIQLAAEIHASGRPVTLAVGRHTRLPRTYRERDVLAWLHDMGVLDQDVADIPDLQASRNQPSLQLTGGEDRDALDLRVLQERGVRLVGRAEGAEGRRMYFADDLPGTLDAADAKLGRVLARIDRHVARRCPGTAAPGPVLPVPRPPTPATLDLRAEGIRAVLWATGYRTSYPWLRVPVLSASGEIRHDRGVTPAAGLYVLGLNLLRRRSSSFLAGVGADAEALAEHLVAAREGRVAPLRHPAPRTPAAAPRAVA